MSTTIGKFSKKDEKGVAIGNINTLDLSLSGVRIVPNTRKRSEESPDVHFMYQDAHIGSGWEKLGKESNQPYTSVVISDPSLKNPITATLHENEEGGYELVHRP